MLTGTMIGFIVVAALLAASIVLAILDRRQQGEKKQLSRAALGLFVLAFLGGVAVTLVGGVKPRQESGIAGMMQPPGVEVGEAGAIGSVDQNELRALQGKVVEDPKDVKSRERLGHLYLQMQDYENVFKTAHETLQLNPESVESRVHIGMVLFVMNQPEEAMSQFDRALQKDPDFLEALAFKGMVELQGRNDPKAARKTWGKYLKRAKPGDPGWGMVQVMMSQLESED